jgi:HAD superfamily hydrolase (TIGR01549 family)
MKKYKAILYDIDGTLMDTFEMNMIPLMQIIQEELGQAWTLEQVRPFYAQPGLKTITDLGIRDVETVYARWVEYVNAYEKSAVPFPGMEAVLKAFRDAGIRQAVVSSKMREQYRIDVCRYGLDAYMETAVLAEDTSKHKPNPEPLLTCLARLGITAEEALYVGDTLADYQAAKNAGMDFALAGWGVVLPEGWNLAEYLFSAPEDMLKLL